MPSSRNIASRVRRRVVYHGRVQGVGFRFTAATIARMNAVNGYVKNLPDGAVELVVDAPTGVFKKFHDAIQAEFDANITQEVVEEFESDEEFDGFEIRYY